MKRRIKTESGFTLLELLISLALVAVLVTACLMAVRLATASREAGFQKIDLHQRLRVIHERLHSTLRSTHLIFISPESQSLLEDEKEGQTDTTKILAFEGKPDSLKFVTFSDKLMTGSSSPWMHEIRFYLQKNEETGLLEILMNERDFSPKDFFNHQNPGLKKGQTLVLAQDVAHLSFRYYLEKSEEGISENGPGEIQVKVSGQWTDKIITEPIDFKSNIADNKNIDNNKESIILPRAVEVSVGLTGPVHSEKGQEPQMVELPLVIIPMQTGMVFARFGENEEASGALKE